MKLIDILKKNKVYLEFETNQDYISWCLYQNINIGYLTGMALRNNRCFISYYEKYTQNENKMPSQLDSAFRKHKYRRIKIKSSWINQIRN